MSDFTDVNLVGPGGRGGILRLYPKRCQVLFADVLGVGDGSLKSLYQFLEKRMEWDGGNVIIKPTVWFDRIEVKVKSPQMSEYILLTGSRKEVISALKAIAEANPEG